MFSDSINVFFKQVRKNIIYFSIELFLQNNNNDTFFLYLTWGSEALRQENRESSPPDPASIPPNPGNVHGQIVHKQCQTGINLQKKREYKSYSTDIWTRIWNFFPLHLVRIRIQPKYPDLQPWYLVGSFL